MDKITLSDGRQFDVETFAIAASGHMFIRVKMPMNQAAIEFSHDTEHIIYEPEEQPSIAINGFSELAYIVNESECVRVALIRPMDIQEV